MNTHQKILNMDLSYAMLPEVIQIKRIGGIKVWTFVDPAQLLNLPPKINNARKCNKHGIYYAWKGPEESSMGCPNCVKESDDRQAIRVS